MKGILNTAQLNRQPSPPEEQLIPIITKGKNLICPDLELFSTEIDSGFGIADIVFYNLDRRNADYRKEAAIPRIKSYEILETLSLINELAGEQINITQLYKKLPYSEKVFEKKILGFFIKNNIAEFTDGNHMSLKYKYEISLKETIAIEAKVSNWKRGLYQAYRYKQYSDYSYLALHKNHISAPQQNIELFIKLNIGLICVDTENNSIEMIYRPKKDQNVTSDWVKYYANESILVENGYINCSCNSIR